MGILPLPSAIMLLIYYATEITLFCTYGGCQLSWAPWLHQLEEVGSWSPRDAGPPLVTDDAREEEVDHLLSLLAFLWSAEHHQRVRRTSASQNEGQQEVVVLELETKGRGTVLLPKTRCRLGTWDQTHPPRWSACVHT